MRRDVRIGRRSGLGCIDIGGCSRLRIGGIGVGIGLHFGIWILRFRQWTVFRSKGFHRVIRLEIIVGHPFLLCFVLI